LMTSLPTIVGRFMLDSTICRLRRSQQVIDPSAHPGRAFEGLGAPAHHDCRLGT
jgi:hypothetical protein